MAARDQKKAIAAKDEILGRHPKASLEIVELDLGSLASVKNCAETILAAHEKIDVLMNNAGLMALPEGKTADGFEMQLGVNHLGHWALTCRLMPALLRADRARVVSVTSTAHHMGSPVDPSNPNLEGRYDPWLAYGRSKLANYHFALGLQEQFDRAGIDAMSLLSHPGLTYTDLQGKALDAGASGFLGSFFHKLARGTGMTVEAGARPQLRAATDPNARGGWFYAPRYVNNGAAVRRRYFRPGREAAIAKLWEVSEHETGLALDLRAAPH